MVELGYDGHPWLRENLRRLSTPRLSWSVAVVLGDHAIILAAGVASVALFRALPAWLAVLLYVPTALLAARQMRGLECLVHDSSHFNWTRNRLINDRLANILGAWPVLSRVHSYRETHTLHHRLLGTEQDTDLIRWRQLRLDQLRRDRPLEFWWGFVRRVVPYVPGWWWAIGVDPGTVIRFVVWHATVIGGLYVVSSARTAVLVWILGWMVPCFAVLPVIRFLGEIEEHHYPVTTALESTNTNIGILQILLLHPHGDGYHTIHHIYPSIPFFRVARVHRKLMDLDPYNYGAKVRVRRRILDHVGERTALGGDRGDL